MNTLKRMLVPFDSGSVPARTEDAGGPSDPTRAPAGERCRTIPRPWTLDAVAEELTASEGLSLLELEPLTTLVVRTSHSVYRMIVLDGTTVLLRGGAFAGNTIAHLHGSGFGGHMLRVGWIGVGLRMEFSAEGKRVLTSTVRAVAIEDHPSTDWSQ